MPRRHRDRLLARALGMAGLVIVGASGLQSQTVVTGHYQPGLGPSQLARAWPRYDGWYFERLTVARAVKSFRDAGGSTLVVGKEPAYLATDTGFTFRSGWTLLGGEVAFGGAIPLTTLAPNPMTEAGTNFETKLGLGDISLLPLLLDWRGERFYRRASYTVFAPTGRFVLGESDNTGLGFWTHMVSGSTVRYPSSGRGPLVSAMGRYEIHSAQDGRDLTPGDTLTIEAAVGWRWGERYQAGLVAYHWAQVSDATGRDAQNEARYRVWGLGLELERSFRRVVITARLVRDLDARNAGEGMALMLQTGSRLSQLRFGREAAPAR